MLRASWASLMARKLRLFMSAFAVILGVAFVAGSFIFTDTLGTSFTELTKSSAGDVVVRATGASGVEEGPSRRVPADVVPNVAAVPGAARADGNVSDFTTFVVSKRNKLIGGQGAPGIAVNHTGGPAAHGIEPSRLVRGEWPTGPDEVVLDATTAKASGYLIGEQVRFVSAGSEATFEAKLVGIHEMTGGSMLGASVTVMDTAMAQRLYEKGTDQFSDVWVTADSGTSQEQLRDEVAKVLPAGYEAVTGDQLSEEMANEIQRGLSFITTFLLVFAAVALVVGTFLIINTFSILVAQRSRELALFRAIGASRRQVTRSVLFEAFIVGLIGSTAGLALGFGLAAGIRMLFSNFGLDLSGATLVLNPRTVIASYAVGLIVTMLAAYLPARRAGLVPPVAAMRDDAVMREGALRKRIAVGLLLTAAGAGAMFFGLRVAESNEGRWLGAGILGVLIGVALTSPLVGRPVITGLGWIYRKTFGVVGTMATQNSLRNPRRTAATASALMIGVALVTLMSIFGASAKSSIDEAITKDVTADYVVSNAIGQPFSTQIASDIRQIDGVGNVAAIRYAPLQVDPAPVDATSGDAASGDAAPSDQAADPEESMTYAQAIDPAAIVDMANVTTTAGRFADLAPGKVSIGKDEAAKRDLTVGSTVDLAYQGTTKTFTVASVHESSAVLGGNYIVTLADFEAMHVPTQDSVIYVTRETGASQREVLRTIDAALADNPVVTVKDQTAFADEQRKPIDQMLAIIYALLGLAVVIAILGIVNTLALSVIERTREIGLLRAVGLSRRQLRTMLRLESVVIALLGAALGVGMGLAFGVAIQRSLAGQGFHILTIPWNQLALFLGLSIVVGVLASLWPGRRAARIDILRAITTE